MKIGIMGGTFNPIHMGHLLVAQEAVECFGFQKIIFIPNNVPPHRNDKKIIVDPEIRYTMVYLALQDNPRFFTSRIEIDREGVSYTYDTIREMKALYPGVGLSFITGVDSLIKSQWKYLDELLGILDFFIAATRPGFDENQLKTRISELGLKNHDRIRVMKIPGVGISSTLIRERCRAGRSVKYMVPREVETLINKKHLYK